MKNALWYRLSTSIHDPDGAVHTIMPFNNMKLQLFSMSRGALAKFTTVKLIKAS
ncbi:hypothetical protein [Methanobacterium sp.]|uniref:hypothetical protein n=1 Tax=Methanobacterium sp. TaxID=2164 RepID=UPI002ABAACBD|nr:hypothetical protein [Methanobacterium sp.]MDY9924268.1 hypothetical protein [Methanobacterium sp.]